MDELIADLSTHGFPTVRVNFPRSVSLEAVG